MQGVISKVFTNPTKWGNRYSFQINGSNTFYGTNKEQPPEAGTTVTFDEEQKGQYWSAVNLKVVRDQPVQQGVKINNVRNEGGREDYWRQKDERDVERQKTIELQSCRNSAIEFVKLLITPQGGEVGLKLPAQAKREEFLRELVTKYTAEFLDQNNNGLENKNNDDGQQLDLDGSADSAADGEWKV